MFVCCECRVLSGGGLCEGLITRSEESYRLWRVVVCDQETSYGRMLQPRQRAAKYKPTMGCRARKKKIVTTRLLRHKHSRIYTLQSIPLQFLCAYVNNVLVYIFTSYTTINIIIHTIKCYKRIIILIVLYDVNIYTNCIDTQRDGFDKVNNVCYVKVRNILLLSTRIISVIAYRYFI